MTIIAAAKYADSVIIVSDSLVTSSNKKIKNIKNFSKLVKFGDHFVVGFAGDCSIFPVLRELSTDETYLKKKYIRMRNQQDALKFTKDVYTRLSENMECSPLNRDKEDEPISEMLIASKYGIFEAEPSPFACEISDFSAIGAGEFLAIGALNVLFDEVKDKETLIKALTRAIMITTENTTECALPMSIMEL